MKKKSGSQFIVMVLLIVLIFVTVYLVFGDDLKAQFIVYVFTHHKWTPQSNDLNRFLNETIGNNSGSIFFKPLMKLLNHKNYEISSGALSMLDYTMLSRSSAWNKNVLIGNLQSKDMEIRRFSVYLLGRSGDPFMLPHIEKVLLNDPDYKVRRSAIDGVYLRSSKDVVPILINALKDRNPEVRAAAAYTLGENKDIRALEPLLNMASDKNEKVRSSVVVSLKLLDNETATKKIVEMLGDKSQEVRRLSAYSLEGNNSEFVREALIESALDQNNKCRWYAISGLKYSRDSRKVDPLIRIFQSTAGNSVDSRKVRSSIIDALSNCRNTKTIKLMTECLNDSDSLLKIDAALALGSIGDGSVVPSLIEALKDKDPAFRSAVISSLGAIGDKRAIPPLTELLYSYNTKDSAMRALVKIKGKEAHKILFKYIRDNRLNMTQSEKYGVVSTFLMEMEEVDSEGVELLASFLPDIEYRGNLVKYLGDYGNKNCLKYLDDLLVTIEDEIKSKVEAERKKRLIPGDMVKYEKEVRMQYSDLIDSTKKAINSIKIRCNKQ